MSWQNCPHCSGSGLRSDTYSWNQVEACPVCYGARIIHHVTGRPPEKVTGAVKIMPVVHTCIPSSSGVCPICERFT